MTCTAEDLVVALRAVSAAVVDHGDELTELDRAIGDADHGENMRRGFLAVAAKVDSPGQTTPAAVLKAVGTTLISTVGGASGPLYGTAFLRAATSLADVSEVDGVAVAAALRAALGGVVARGRAEVGDKTMVDALAPAADAAATAAEGGGDVPAVLAAAAEAAERGAESTKPLVARKGRASYLGERSAGHLDPGARSTALVLRALATAAGAR
ncbi:dihydroxyacetone kinase subunit DhaL [Streptoalloteichus hindustanus]|uniref:dihydroxyacetone kinase subunit DhaL n=1 Tax=Streptoalloteichus hindustanus TaxID=2017 RepID=UPI000937411E|nr:dihydroxyacetone kinase subunit DhaL [Streptoalloteichus hindustanus]